MELEMNENIKATRWMHKWVQMNYVIYISALGLHMSPAVALPSISQLQTNVEYVAHFRGNCQQTYLGL